MVQAIERVLADPAGRTRDIGGKATTASSARPSPRRSAEERGKKRILMPMVGSSPAIELREDA